MFEGEHPYLACMLYLQAAGGEFQYLVNGELSEQTWGHHLKIGT